MANREDVFSGHYDVELEEKGRIQARCTASYVTSAYSVDKVYASDLKRAYETGKAVADILGMDVIPKSGLREIDGGKWEKVPFAELPRLFSEDYKVWMEDIGQTRCTGGEAVKELVQRVMGTLEEIAKENDGKTVVIATHATPIRATQSVIQTGGVEQMKNIPWVSNASVSEIEYHSGEWKFIQVGYDKHLAEMRTELPEDI